MGILKEFKMLKPIMQKIFPSHKERMIRTQSQLSAKELEIKRLQLDRERKNLGD